MLNKIIKSLVVVISLLVIGSCAGTYKSFRMDESSLGTNRTLLSLGNNEIEVDNVLLPYVKEYMKDAYNNGVNVDSIAETYMGIYVDLVAYGHYGETYYQTPYKDFSIINPAIVDTPNKLRLIVFHELHHKFSKEKHCHTKCDEIFSATLNKSNFYNNWEKQKETLFKNKKHGFEKNI